MFNPLHDEVLAMILRQLKRYVPSHELEIFTDGVEGYISEPYSPSQEENTSGTGGDTGGTGSTGGTTVVNVTTGETIGKIDVVSSLLDGFDYVLLYNEEDELVGFTSHNGNVSYTLNLDEYQDLVSITVDVTLETDTVSFKIALIFENYDMRVDTSSTDDKGKLVEVVILDLVDSRFTLEITPALGQVNVGSTIQFTATAKFLNGDVVDVTNEAEWIIGSPNTIDRGLVTANPSETGSYPNPVSLIASYNGKVATANVRIDTPVVEPPVVEPPISHEYNYKMVLRWEGLTDTDMDLRLKNMNTGMTVMYNNKIVDDTPVGKAWLDRDYTSHYGPNDYQESPEIITFINYVGVTFELFVCWYSGYPLTQNATVTVYDSSDNLLNTIEISPETFVNYQESVRVWMFKVNSDGLEGLWNLGGDPNWFPSSI